MRHGAIKGFTLIEVLVVLFIMSIVMSVALLSISHHEARQLEAFTKELVERLTLAEEQAMLQPAILGLSINKNAYQFASNKKEGWLPLQDTILAHHAIPATMQLSLEMGGKKMAIEQDVPQIVISTNGDITPFTLYVGQKGKPPRYVIHGEADGSIKSTTLT